MNPLHSNGQLDSDIFKDENEQSVKLKFNEENNCWFGNYSLIRFGQHQLTEAEFLIDNDTAHFSANALVGGITLTFDYDMTSNTFQSDEKINIIHIIADQIHTLTDFTIHHNGLITSVMSCDQLIDLLGNHIQLRYDEKNDTWYSEKCDGIKYGLCRFEKAQLFLNDYDLIIKGTPPFSDNLVEFNFGKTGKDIYFHTSKVNWKVGPHDFRQADIRYYVNGQLEASAQLFFYGRWVDFSYANGQMHGKAEITKKYYSPEKGCFENKPYYQLNILHEINIDIFNSKQISTVTNHKVTNPFILMTQNKGPSPKTVELTLDEEDKKYKANIPQQTAMYKGLAKNGFLGEYYFEESKQYIYDPNSEILTVGTKFLEGHGKIFYKKVFNYYYKNFEQYSVVKGIWPFRWLEYQFYYQMLAQASESI
jgi:hypothetical protein